MTRSPPLVAILGAGRLAEVGATLLHAAGVPLRFWARRPEAAARVASHFAGSSAGEIGEVTKDAGIVLIAVPAPAIAEVAGLYGPYARGDQIVLHASRGVAPGFVLPHAAIRSRTCVRKIGALGGPLHSQDLSSGRPLATVLASRFDETYFAIRALVAQTPLRVLQSRDIVGVEVAGAISNVAALAAGMAEALGLGETARGVLLTHGLSEAQRLGVALGADPATFTGLAGVGDLIPRRVSSTNRHHEVGALIAKGEPLEGALASAKGSVEGVLTAAEAVILGVTSKLSLPLVSAVDAILKGADDPRRALENVLRKDLDLGAARAAARA